MSKIITIDRPYQCIYRKNAAGITDTCYCSREECKKGNYVLICNPNTFPEECPLVDVRQKGGD